MAFETWHSDEAEKILAHVGSPTKPIVMETGFGPSGLPHIGTLGEVVRTSFIIQALRERGATDTRLYVFSDDMDGLRKVPLNVPGNVGEHLGKPVCRIPDPWGCCKSYSGHMNAKLLEMLGRFGCQFTFKSSEEQYGQGVFDEGLSRMLEKVEDVRGVILPTLSPDKREDWSPFFPLCERCGRVTTTRVTEYDKPARSIAYVCGQDGAVKGCGNTGKVLVTGGRVKAGWKPDWALRWFTFGIAYEMFGKDLIESAVLSRRICEILGRPAPLDFFYELFLDEDGSKISKSIGRGVTVDRWLEYAPEPSLALFMFRNPRRAKRLFLGVIPQACDDLLGEVKAHYNPAPLKAPAVQDAGKAALKDAPAAPHSKSADPRRSVYPLLVPSLPAGSPYPEGLSYGMLTNLAAAIGRPDAELIASYVRRSLGWPEGDDGPLRTLIDRSLKFYAEVLLPSRTVYTPTERELPAVKALAAYLATEHAAEEIQTQAFQIAREHTLKDHEFFTVMYRIFSGQERGPRLGSFVKILGQQRARQILDEAVTRAAS